MTLTITHATQDDEIRNRRVAPRGESIALPPPAVFRQFPRFVVVRVFRAVVNLKIPRPVAGFGHVSVNVARQVVAKTS